jgi:ABC-type sulfate transport system permease subunit
MMSKFEKRLVVFALIFVAIYLGAAAITIHTRITKEDKMERLESPDLTPAEGQLLIAELFLPVMILFTLTICFIIVRKQRAKKLLRMEEDEKAEGEIEAP